MGFFGLGKGKVGDRLKDYTATDAGKAEEVEAGPQQSILTRQLNKAIEGRGFAADMATQLARADLKITVGEYLALLVIVVIAGVALGYLIFMRSPIFGLLGGVVAFFIPRFYIGFAQGQRQSKFDNQLGDTLNLMVNGLRAGYSVLQAMEAVSREMPSPMSVEFGRVVKEVQLGLTVEQSLDNMLRRVRSDDLDMVVTAINVQREVGGNLGEILEVISHTIRERVRIRGEVKTLTAQGMMTGYVISGVPVALFFLIFLINRPYASRLFEFPCGVSILVCGLILIIVGFVVMMKIVQIDI